MYGELDSTSLVFFACTVSTISLLVIRTEWYWELDAQIKYGKLTGLSVFIYSLDLLVLWCLDALAVLLLLYLLYRLLFIGSLSKYPRKLSGLDGSMSSFISGTIIIFNFLSLFGTYGFLYDRSSGETSKPGWAEYLG